jgi:hypothetical protein
VRRSLVQALLMRLAVAQHGVNEKLAAPLWLEHAGEGWWITRAAPAQLDALKQESARLAPPALADVLGWQRSDVESRALAVGAVWLLEFFQTESGPAGEWREFLRRIGGGDEAMAALTESFPGRFGDEVERELWWQTGWHQLRRQHALPSLGAADSRGLLAASARFVWTANGRDAVVPLPDVLRRAREPAVVAELKVRLAEVNRVLPALHPFYRNAGIALADAFQTRSNGEAMAAAFEREWREATELETATNAALDALGRRR